MRAVIRIDRTAVDELVAHSRAELPNEACGYLVGEQGHVVRFIPLTNAAASPTRFVLDPHEQLAAERALEEAGETVIGVAHSHPTGDNRPSAVDIDDAARFDPLGAWIHVVVSPSSGSVRAFRIAGGEVEELALET